VVNKQYKSSKIANISPLWHRASLIQYPLKVVHVKIKTIVLVCVYMAMANGNTADTSTPSKKRRYPQEGADGNDREAMVNPAGGGGDTEAI